MSQYCTIPAWPRSFPCLARCVVGVAFLLETTVASAEDSTTRQLREVLEENMAACTNEDLPRLLKTMSEEMPNRELFVEECKKEWAEHDIYYRLDDVKILKQDKWRPPYLVATVRETQWDKKREGAEGRADDVAANDLSNRMSLRTTHPTTESEYLFKQEGGKWKVVAGISDPRPVASSKR
jgi:hypothetical protein